MPRYPSRMNPKIRNVLFPLLAALCGALASYFAAGCTPAQIDRAESAVDHAAGEGIRGAECVRAVVEKFDDLLTRPLEIQPSDVLAFKAELRACLKPPVGDAGTE